MELLKRLLKNRKRAISPHSSILYVCDRRECEHCSATCHYTHDIKHAENFRRILGDIYVEDNNKVSD